MDRVAQAATECTDVPWKPVPQPLPVLPLPAYLFSGLAIQASEFVLILASWRLPPSSEIVSFSSLEQELSSLNFSL